MSKTIKNLTEAFIGESMARNRYDMYASLAKKEGYVQIHNVFKETAEQEHQHAKWILRMINQIKEEKGDPSLDEISVEVEAPTILGTTEENLISAIEGENYEHEEMYPEFAETAKKEGCGQSQAH